MKLRTIFEMDFPSVPEKLGDRAIERLIVPATMSAISEPVQELLKMFDKNMKVSRILIIRVKEEEKEHGKVSNNN